MVNGIINNVINGKNEDSIDLQIFDIIKCFDRMWYKETMNGLFDKK